MLSYFRKIRQRLLKTGSLGKYLAYASGEIILVVVGILIALGVNNWYSERKDRDLEQQYLERLSVDLQTDRDGYTFTRSLASLRMQMIDLLSTAGQQDRNDPLVLSHLVESIEKATWRSYLPKTPVVYPELLGTGNMSLIRSVELREILAAYYSKIEHWNLLLNEMESQRAFSRATAGLLSSELLTQIESTEQLGKVGEAVYSGMEVDPDEARRILEAFIKNADAHRWLPKMYHYHVLAEKVAADLDADAARLMEMVKLTVN